MQQRLGGQKPKFRLDDVEAALRASGGIYTGAAEVLARAMTHAHGHEITCAPNTIRNYVRRSKSLQRVCEEIDDINLDISESQLLQQVRAGNMTAIIWYQRNKGRHRGWGAPITIGGTVEHRHAHLHVMQGQLAAVGLDLEKYSDEQLQAIEDFASLMDAPTQDLRTALALGGAAGMEPPE